MSERIKAAARHRGSPRFRKAAARHRGSLRFYKAMLSSIMLRSTAFAERLGSAARNELGSKLRPSGKDARRFTRWHLRQRRRRVG